MTEQEVLTAILNKSDVRHPKNPDIGYCLAGLIKVHTDEGWTEGVMYFGVGQGWYVRPLKDFGKFYLA